MNREFNDQDNVGTLIQVDNADDAGVLKNGTVYLIYDQKGFGLDLVNLSSCEVPYLRVLESERRKHFRAFPTLDAKDLVTRFLAQRARLMQLIAGSQGGETTEMLRRLAGGNNAETGVHLVGALRTIAKFERDLKDLENHAEFLAEFPSMELDIDKPVRRRGARSMGKPGSVIGLKKPETRLIACVQWSDGNEEDVDIADLVNE